MGLIILQHRGLIVLALDPTSSVGLESFWFLNGPSNAWLIQMEVVKASWCGGPVSSGLSLGFPGFR